MRFLKDRLWPQIQPNLETAREVLVTTWNLTSKALSNLANAAPKARIRLIIDRAKAPPPFTCDEYRSVRDQFGDRLEIRENPGLRVLHAKVLIVRGPSDFAIVGSCNLTRPGFGCDESGNIEASVIFEQGPEFNNILAWFEKLFSETRPYVQLQNALIRVAYPSSEIAQRLLEDERPHEQEGESKSFFEDTLPTTSGGLAELTRRVIDGSMKELPHQLYDYQQAILQALDQSWEWSQDNKAFRELIVLPVGAGKTQIAAAFITQRLSQSTTPLRILWVAHTLQLVEQAASVVFSHLSSREIQIPLLFWVGSAKSTEEAKQLRRADPCMAFATIQSVNNLRNELTGRSTFDLVVIDEAHHIGAPKWRTAIRKACCSGTGSLLGLTATPERLDEVELPFNEPRHDGGVTFRTLVERGILAVPKYQAVQTKRTVSLGLPSQRNVAAAQRYFETNIKVFDEPSRNRFIARDLAKRDSGQTLVFCATKNHADNLEGELKQAGLPHDQVRSVHSELSITKRAEALEWFRAAGSKPRILLNCKLYIEGFDMTDVRTIVLARPTLSPTYWVQMIGRGVRRSPEHASFDIIEYTDTYEEEKWDALRASFYLLHDKGLEWWQDLRTRWPDSIEPEQIKKRNRITQNIYAKMIPSSEIDGPVTPPLNTAQASSTFDHKRKRVAA